MSRGADHSKPAPSTLGPLGQMGSRRQIGVPRVPRGARGVCDHLRRQPSGPIGHMGRTKVHWVPRAAMGPMGWRGRSYGCRRFTLWVVGVPKGAGWLPFADRAALSTPPSCRGFPRVTRQNGACVTPRQSRYVQHSGQPVLGRVPCRPTPTRVPCSLHDCARLTAQLRDL
jgi:hypothetical protein